jgi:hypothetical protein
MPLVGRFKDLALGAQGLAWGRTESLVAAATV